MDYKLKTFLLHLKLPTLRVNVIGNKYVGENIIYTSTHTNIAEFLQISKPMNYILY